MTFVFQKVHDNRRGDVIGQVCNDLNRSAAVFFADDGINIRFQNILIQNLDIVIVLQGLLQNGNQRIVDFHRNHLSCIFCQNLRQRADAGADFQHTVLFSYACAGSNVVQNIGINQKILTKIFLICKAVRFDNLFCFAGG